LNTQNSFDVLDNEVIVELAYSMGVHVSNLHFETFDLMKDIELARHAIDKVQKIPAPDPNGLIERPELINNEISLLQWLEEDSESEHFRLV
jgi:hypothetical protein